MLTAKPSYTMLKKQSNKNLTCIGTQPALSKTEIDCGSLYCERHAIS